MQFSEEILPGAWRVRLERLADARGEFVKTYSHNLFLSAGVDFQFREEFYSVSQKDVIRGMHFQTPPHDHDKIVYCAAGAVEDVLLDLRKGADYGKHISLTLSADRPELIVVPRGIAHGFRSLKDGSLMVYKTSTEHAPKHDMGIRWDSFGFEWRCESPILSARDLRHQAFADFTSPF